MSFIRHRRSILVVLVCMALLALLAAGCGGAKPAEPEKPKAADKATEKPAAPKEAAKPAEAAKALEWRVLSSWGKELAEVNLFLVPFVDEVNKRAAGKLKVTWFGPEAVPAFEQTKPVRDGVYDALFTAGGYHGGDTMVGMMIMMGVLDSLKQAKDIGLEDVTREAYKERLDMELLSLVPAGGYHLVLRDKKLDKADLKGLKIRSTPFYDQGVQRLGGSTVVLPGGEIYTSLERKVIDGYAWTASDTIVNKWYEVSKYLLRPKFLQSMYLMLGSNKTWSKLPPDLQKLVKDTAMEVAGKAHGQIVQGQIDEEQKLIKDHKMETVVLPPAEADKYVNAFYAGNWEKLFAGKDAKYGDRIRAITDKLPRDWKK